ncbi:MAG: HAMP domain-containing histidine kinase [Coprobacillus sp.]|nr:HAMP domain-containing histidine kinase [Coprobacillus sp.]
MPKKDKKEETPEVIASKQRRKWFRNLFGRTAFRFGFILFLFVVITMAITLGITAIFLFGRDREYAALDIFIILVVALVVDMILSFIITAIMLRNNQKNTEQISQALDKLANGDFDIHIELVRAARPIKRMADRLNEIAKELDSVSILKQDYIRDFSHEFKTPIAAIQGYAELLLKDKTLSEKDKEKYFQIIIDETEYLAKLANSSLLLSDLESQNIAISKDTYYIDEQIEECALLLYQDVEFKNIEVDIDVSHVLLEASKDLTRELWINLISNAVKYTDPNGHIKIYSYETEEKFVICVSDDGIGISQDALPHIFESYYREKNEKVSKGSGLGLSICKKICEGQGWDITVSSKKGEGSIFSIIIPKVAKDE